MVLCLGAHPDDVEIGCAGALAALHQAQPSLRFQVAVFCGDPSRVAEARTAAARLLGERLQGFHAFGLEDGGLPQQAREARSLARSLARLGPDLVFAHAASDAHQDHRLVRELAWQSFRRATILEYEIPKYDGDLDRPNLYVPLTAKAAADKVELLWESFHSQREKDWFRPEVFLGLMRLRGMECRAPEGYAEAFHARKLVVSV